MGNRSRLQDPDEWGIGWMTEVQGSESGVQSRPRPQWLILLDRGVTLTQVVSRSAHFVPVRKTNQKLPTGVMVNGRDEWFQDLTCQTHGADEIQRVFNGNGYRGWKLSSTGSGLVS